MKPGVLKFIAAALLAVTLSGCVRVITFGIGEGLLERAEEQTRRGKLEDAIATYRKHIQERLEVADRPAWENPYFYLLIIGDLQLKRELADDALASYEEAEKQGVEIGLVSDRYRFVASWYEQRGDLAKAIRVLEKYRDRDPLLADAMLDRLAKALTVQEERAREEQLSKSAKQRDNTRG